MILAGGGGVVTEPAAIGSGPARSGVTRKATIQDVAQIAGVGRQTVSNVLNGSGRVGEAARARVLDAVTVLGYQPHHGARSLRSRRTRQFAYIMPRIQLRPRNLIMMHFLQALAAQSARRHYGVLIVVPDADPRDDMRRMIASRSVDAFVLSELKPGDPRVELLAEQGVPFACFGRTSASLPQSWADIDNTAAQAAAVSHVLEQGFTRLAYVGYATPEYWDADRAAGFRAGLASHGLPDDSATRIEVPDDPSAHGQILSMIAAVRPDAVIAGSDRIAVTVYNAAAELGLRIGRDLAVTGFDGSVAGDLLSPRLTSVAIPVDEIARRIVDRVLRQIDHGQDPGPGEIVPFTLRIGRSTIKPLFLNGSDASL
jgi:DNA-binding LacI/PurR family transcriptional regulator